MNDGVYSLKWNLCEYSDEVYSIAKFLHETDKEVPDKVIGAVVELLVDEYIQNASYENIKEVFEILITIQDADIDWENSYEVNDILEKYF